MRSLLRAPTKKRARLKARRPIHKKLLLHPAAIFILLCVGVLLLASSWNAAADGGTDTASWTVHGKVPAPPLTEPGKATSVTNGQHFSVTPVEISGTCPDDSYVKVYRNDIFAGVAICINQTFDPMVDLVPGENDIQVHVFNITDDEGPLSDPVVVYYDPPLPVTDNSSSGSSSSSSGQTPAQAAQNPFLITSDYSYRGYLPKQTIEWQINTAGGTPPYGFTIKWGDGRESTYVQKSAGSLDIKHAYSRSGNYVIGVSGTDSDGNSSYLQLMAIVSGPPLQFFGTTSGPLSQASSFTQRWLWAAWPAYLVLILMTLSFWLGERQELRLLRPKKRTRRR